MEKDTKSIREAVKSHKHILICGNNNNPLGIIRSLGEVGIEPIVIIQNAGYPCVQYSKYISKIHFSNSFEESLSILKSYSDASNKPFVYTSDDNHESMLDEHLEELEEYFYFYHADKAGVVTFYMDKNNICDLAAQCGFQIPNKETVSLGELPKHLKYPIFTKTLNPCINGWKHDVMICYSEDELTEAYKHMISEKFLMQEYIEKKNELSIQGFSINEGKELYLPFKRQYFRTSQKNFGYYCYYYPFDDSSLFIKIQTLIQKIGYSGNFEIEFLEKLDGSLVFLEINFRHAMSNYASTTAGVNLPVEWAIATINGHIGDIHPTKTNFTAINEWPDFQQSVRTKQISFFKWLKDLIKADSYYLFNKKDPKPFFGWWLAKIIRRKR